MFCSYGDVLRLVLVICQMLVVIVGVFLIVFCLFRMSLHLCGHVVSFSQALFLSLSDGGLEDYCIS